MLTPPAGFSGPSITDFEVYINGRRVPNSQINSIVQSGNDIVVTVDVPAFLETPGAIFEQDDQVLLIGKFN